MKVVVVGAGIAGLAAAWELLRTGEHAVTMLESERRSGGVVVTERVDDFVVEGGPDGFLAGETELPALAVELGIGDRVVDQQVRGTALWNGKKLAPVEEGRAAALLGIEAKSAEVAAGFRSFAAGMSEPVVELTRRLGGELLLAQGVAGLTGRGDGWQITVTGGSAHEADAVVLALPAYAAAPLLEAAGVPHARELAEVVYAPSVTVSLAYKTAQLGRPLEGAGFVVDPGTVDAQHAAPLQLRACTFSSAKYPHRAPKGHVLLRAFLSPGNADPGQAAHAQLAAILRLRGEPLWHRSFHWARGLPRYHATHREHLADLRHRLQHLPPIAIAGAGYDGAGVSACVRSGREAARLIARWTAR